VRYAGFWIRFLARFIDGMILGMAGLILRLPLLLMLGMGTGRGYSFGMTPALEAAMGVSLLVISWAWLTRFTLSRREAPRPARWRWGSKLSDRMGLRSTPAWRWAATLQHFISGITLGIGYIMAAFDSQKRALHDRICETRVIYAR